MLPIAPHHLALEAAAGADRHRQNITRLWDGLELDLFAESNVTVCDGFLILRPLAADAEGRNPEAYLDCLRHFDGQEKSGGLAVKICRRIKNLLTPSLRAST